MKGIPITLEIAAVTDIGQSRSSNQDNFFVNGTFVDHYRVKTERFDCVDNEEVHVLAVCDGMGGLKDGDVAAMTGVTTLSDFSEELQSIRTYEDASYTARSLIRKANDRILRKSKKTGKKMGSTLAMLIVTSECLYACNLGDSEIYLKNDYGMERLSKPQTVAQELVDRGALAQNQAKQSFARNQLYKYLGMENLKGLVPNECYSEIRNGDILLICSDGVSDALQSHSIYACLNSNRPIKEIADNIIEKALRRGSHDNLTVVIARVLDDGRETRLRRLIGAVLGITAAVLFLTTLIVWLI